MLLLSSLTPRQHCNLFSQLTSLLPKISKYKFSHTCNNCKPTLMAYSLTIPLEFSQPSHRLLQTRLKELLPGRLLSRLLLKISNKHGETLPTRPNTNGIRLKLLQTTSTRTQLLPSITINNRELQSSTN